MDVRRDTTIWRRLFELLSILFVLLFSYFVRTTDMGNHALTVDERINMTRVIHSPRFIIDSLASQGPPGEDISPPLYHLILHAFTMAGEGDFWVRLPGVLAGVGCVAVVYLLGGLLFSRYVGYISALLLACNVYQIILSQIVRPYGVMLFFCGAALLALMAALKQHRGWLFVAALFLALSFYTNYTASGYLAGFLAVWGGGSVAGLALRRRTGANILYEFKTLLAACCLATLLYLPWVRSHLYALKYALTTYPPTPGASFDWGQVVNSLEEFMPLNFPGAKWYTLAAFALTVLGILRGIIRGRLAEIILLTGWALGPLIIFVASGSPFPFYARRFCGVLFPLTLFIGLGIEAIASGVNFTANSLTKMRLRTPGVLVGVLVALLLLHPMYAAYGRLMSWRLSPGYEAALDILLNRNNCQYEYDSGVPHVGFLLSWYLPRVVKPLPLKDDMPYRRTMVFLPPRAAPDATEQAGTRIARFREEYLFDSYRVGLLHKGRLAMCPDKHGDFVYEDDFSTLTLYTDAFHYENALVDTTKKSLMIYDREKKASVQYVFKGPGGYSPASADLELGVELTANALSPTRDHIGVSVVCDGKERMVGKISSEDFTDAGFDGKTSGNWRLTKTFHLPKEALAGPGLEFRLFMEGRSTISIIEVRSLRIVCRGEPVAVEDDYPVRFALKELEDSGALYAFTPGARPVGGAKVMAFMLDEGISRPAVVGGPEQREHFLTSQPGIRPVAELRDATGKNRCELYDPYLEEPFVSLGMKGNGAYEWEGSVPDGAVNLTLQGAIDHPELEIDGTRMVVPVRAPKDSLLQLGNNGTSELLFRPVFSANLPSPRFFLQDKIRVNPYGPNLQCKGGEPCKLMYMFQSEWPIKEMTVTYRPRVFNDPEKLNSVELSYSIEPDSFKTIHRLRSNGNGEWSPINNAVILRLPLDKPRQTVILQVNMLNEGCQIWSSPEHPMVVHAILDTRAWSGVWIPGKQFTLRATPESINDFTAYFHALSQNPLSELIMKPTLVSGHEPYR
jgi:4-amino-4-deoxy-L-arabinose transferase-like glycosyltransferase